MFAKTVTSWPRGVTSKLPDQFPCFFIGQQCASHIDHCRCDAVCAADCFLHSVPSLKQGDHASNMAVPGADRISGSLHRNRFHPDRSFTGRVKNQAAIRGACHKDSDSASGCTAFFPPHWLMRCWQAECLILVQMKDRMQAEDPFHPPLRDLAYPGAWGEKDPPGFVPFQKREDAVSGFFFQLQAAYIYAVCQARIFIFSNCRNHSSLKQILCAVIAQKGPLPIRFYQAIAASVLALRLRTGAPDPPGGELLLYELSVYATSLPEGREESPLQSASGYHIRETRIRPVTSPDDTS